MFQADNEIHNIQKYMQWVNRCSQLTSSDILAQSILGFLPLLLGSLSLGFGSTTSPLARLASSRSLITALLGLPLFFPVPGVLAAANVLGVELPETDLPSDGVESAR